MSDCSCCCHDEESSFEDFKRHLAESHKRQLSSTLTSPSSNSLLPFLANEQREKMKLRLIYKKSSSTFMEGISGSDDQMCSCDGNSSNVSSSVSTLCEDKGQKRGFWPFTAPWEVLQHYCWGRAPQGVGTVMSCGHQVGGAAVHCTQTSCRGLVEGTQTQRANWTQGKCCGGSTGLLNQLTCSVQASFQEIRDCCQKKASREETANRNRGDDHWDVVQRVWSLGDTQGTCYLGGEASWSQTTSGESVAQREFSLRPKPPRMKTLWVQGNEEDWSQSDTLEASHCFDGPYEGVCGKTFFTQKSSSLEAVSSLERGPFEIGQEDSCGVADIALMRRREEGGLPWVQNNVCKASISIQADSGERVVWLRGNNREETSLCKKRPRVNEVWTREDAATWFSDESSSSFEEDSDDEDCSNKFGYWKEKNWAEMKNWEEGTSIYRREAADCFQGGCGVRQDGHGGQRNGSGKANSFYKGRRQASLDIIENAQWPRDTSDSVQSNFGEETYWAESEDNASSLESFSEESNCMCRERKGAWSHDRVSEEAKKAQWDEWEERNWAQMTQWEEGTSVCESESTEWPQRMRDSKEDWLDTQIDAWDRMNWALMPNWEEGRQSHQDREEGAHCSQEESLSLSDSAQMTSEEDSSLSPHSSWYYINLDLETLSDEGGTSCVDARETAFSEAESTMHRGYRMAGRKLKLVDWEGSNWAELPLWVKGEPQQREEESSNVSSNTQSDPGDYELMADSDAEARICQMRICDVGGRAHRMDCWEEVACSPRAVARCPQQPPASFETENSHLEDYEEGQWKQRLTRGPAEDGTGSETMWLDYTLAGATNWPERRGCQEEHLKVIYEPPCERADGWCSGKAMFNRDPGTQNGERLPCQAAYEGEPQMISADVTWNEDLRRMKHKQAREDVWHWLRKSNMVEQRDLPVELTRVLLSAPYLRHSRLTQFLFDTGPCLPDQGKLMVHVASLQVSNLVQLMRELYASQLDDLDTNLMEKELRLNLKYKQGITRLTQKLEVANAWAHKLIPGCDYYKYTTVHENIPQLVMNPPSNPTLVHIKKFTEEASRIEEENIVLFQNVRNMIFKYKRLLEKIYQCFSINKNNIELSIARIQQLRKM